MRQALLGFFRVFAAALVVVLVGGVLRVAVNDVQTYSTADERHYVEYTRVLAQGGWGVYPALVRAHLADEKRRLHPSPLRYGYLALGRVACAVRTPCDERTLAWMSTLAGALSILLTFAIGARLADRRVGLVAAALTVTSPLQLALGRRALQDEVFVVVALGALWALLRLLQDTGDGARARARWRVALFVALATSAFAVKELFAFSYVGFMALALYLRRGQRLRWTDALSFALPPILYLGLFVAVNHGAVQILALVEATRDSLVSTYSTQTQSGPAHRPLFDLFVLAPVVGLTAAGAFALLLERPADRHRGARAAALLLAFVLGAAAVLPKNARFVALADPLSRLLVAWGLVSLVTPPPREPPPDDRDDRSAVSGLVIALVVLANAAAELWIFRRVFLVRRVYDPTTLNVLKALDVLPRDDATPTWLPSPVAVLVVLVALAALVARPGMLRAALAHAVATPRRRGLVAVVLAVAAAALMFFAARAA